MGPCNPVHGVWRGGSNGRKAAELDLKDYHKNYFPVAVSPQALRGQEDDLIVQQFNGLTPENVIKMDLIQPDENRYFWADDEQIVEFAQAHKPRVNGHNLCWHEQTPEWLFKDAEGKRIINKEMLIIRLHDHVKAVATRYKGRTCPVAGRKNHLLLFNENLKLKKLITRWLSSGKPLAFLVLPGGPIIT